MRPGVLVACPAVWAASFTDPVIATLGAIV
jgi:hypothetical protein